MKIAVKNYFYEIKDAGTVPNNGIITDHFETGNFTGTVGAGIHLYRK